MNQAATTCTESAIRWWREIEQAARVRQAHPVQVAYEEATDLLTIISVRRENKGGRPRKLTEEQAAELVALVRKGLSRRVVGGYFGVCPHTVTRYCQRAGVE